MGFVRGVTGVEYLKREAVAKVRVRITLGLLKWAQEHDLREGAEAEYRSLEKFVPARCFETGKLLYSRVDATITSRSLRS